MGSCVDTRPLHPVCQDEFVPPLLVTIRVLSTASKPQSSSAGKAPGSRGRYRPVLDIPLIERGDTADAVG